MRALILTAGIAFTLAACGKDQSSNTANVDQSLSAENIVSNDVTAIDAVTASDANMAADVNYVPAVDNNGGGNGDASSRPSRQSGSVPANDSAAPASSPQAAPAANSAVPATTNNAN